VFVLRVLSTLLGRMLRRGTEVRLRKRERERREDKETIFLKKEGSLLTTNFSLSTTIYAASIDLY